MTAQGNVTPISERVRLVIELTQVNSDHLLGKSRVAGIEIELEGALMAHPIGERTPQQTLNIELLRERLREANEALRDLEVERARLSLALADVEAAARRNAQ
jgi:hypothetical protein